MAAEVLENLMNAIIDGNSEKSAGFTKEAMEQGLPGIEIIRKGLVAGIAVVGDRFSCGEYYLPELIVSGKAMQAALDLVEPMLAETGGSFHVGNYLIGTVRGDVHDIGKKIVMMMLKGNGWDVTDLGVDVPPEKFCKAIKDGDYNICGLSTLLTVTMPAAGKTIDAIKEAGLRDKVKIMIGGAPVTQEFADKIGADEYAVDAWEAVTKAQKILDGIK
jgi:5-methyltetrahydrofolate--homocysteine methyltransferase